MIGLGSEKYILLLFCVEEWLTKILDTCSRKEKYPSLSLSVHELCWWSTPFRQGFHGKARLPFQIRIPLFVRNTNYYLQLVVKRNCSVYLLCFLYFFTLNKSKFVHFNLNKCKGDLFIHMYEYEDCILKMFKKNLVQQGIPNQPFWNGLPNPPWMINSATCITCEVKGNIFSCLLMFAWYMHPAIISHQNYLHLALCEIKHMCLGKLSVYLIHSSCRAHKAALTLYCWQQTPVSFPEHRIRLLVNFSSLSQAYISVSFTSLSPLFLPFHRHVLFSWMFIDWSFYSLKFGKSKAGNL